jgi:uncharacterized membrane protein
MAESRPADRGPRLAAVDAVRGLALLAMIAYHLAWDLADRRLIETDVVRDPIWRGFAHAIAGTFLVLVGVSLVLATRRGIRWQPFLRRLGLLAAAAALVTLGTYWFAPDAYVFFGILHLILVGSVLALPFLALPSWLVGAAAAAVLVAPDYLASPFFDQPAWWWLGLSTEPPPSVDYVPLVPWFAPILAGILVGRLILLRPDSAFAAWQPAGGPGRVAVVAGRWSLPIYLVHQPILLGALALLAPLLPVNEAAIQHAFQRDCTASCRAVGADMPVCELFCSCVYDGFKGTPLLDANGLAALPPDQKARRQTVIEACQRKATSLGPPDGEPQP